MGLECRRMISRGRSSRTVEPNVLARIIQSRFQVRRLDLNVLCSRFSRVLESQWSCWNKRGVNGTLWRRSAPPAEVTTFELFCAVSFVNLGWAGFSDTNPSLEVTGQLSESPPCLWRQGQVRTTRPLDVKNFPSNIFFFLRRNIKRERERCGCCSLCAADWMRHFCESTSQIPLTRVWLSAATEEKPSIFLNKTALVMCLTSSFVYFSGWLGGLDCPYWANL